MTMGTALHHRGVLSLLTGVASATLAAGITWGVLQSRISLLECKAMESAQDARSTGARLGAIETEITGMRRETAEAMAWVKDALRDLRGRKQTE